MPTFDYYRQVQDMNHIVDVLSSCVYDDDVRVLRYYVVDDGVYDGDDEVDDQSLCVR